MSEKLSENLKEISKFISIDNYGIQKFLEFCEKNIIDKILDRCNIDAIPDRLNSLIQEFLIEQYNLNKEGVGKGVKEISSASDTGQTVTFNTVGGATAVSKNVDEFLDRNMKTLVAYRKIRWN